MLIFSCRNNIGTKYELAKIGPVTQVLWNLLSGSQAQSRTQRFEQNLKQNPNRQETGSGLKLCML